MARHLCVGIAAVLQRVGEQGQRFHFRVLQLDPGDLAWTGKVLETVGGLLGRRPRVVAD